MTLDKIGRLQMNGESVKTRLETDFATTNMPCEDHASMLGTKRSHSLALEVKNVPYCTTQQEDTSVRLSDRKHEEIIPVQCEEQRLQSPMSKLDPTPRSQSTQNVKSSLVTSNILQRRSSRHIVSSFQESQRQRKIVMTTLTPSSCLPIISKRKGRNA